MDREGDRYHADLIRVIANTGIRLGEALWLYSEDVDFKARKLLVRNREGHLLKDREDRAIPLNAVALRALKRRVSEVSQRQCCPLFPDFSGGNYNVQRMGHKIKKRARAAGVPNLTAYGLRHGFGTKMAEVLTPYQLAAVMGHAKIETTNKYYVHREKMQITIPPLVG